MTAVMKIFMRYFAIPFLIICRFALQVIRIHKKNSFNFVKYVTEMMHTIVAISERQGQMMRDLHRIQSVVIQKNASNLPPDMVFQPKRHTTIEGFEAFCDKLQSDRGYQEIYVSVQRGNNLSPC